jgi:DNA-binding transcriptional regulator LsrR (DeoR family)
MIDMVDKNQILINYYRDGESKSSIARRLKISRKTVRRCIEEHEQIYGKTLSKDLLESGIH